MNSKLLRSVMVLNGDTNAIVSAFLGISEQSFSNKINESGTQFKQNEIAMLKGRYNLSADLVDQIFFAD